MDIYSRLFKYRDTPSKSPLENFLTEALADIFNRLPMNARTEFLVWMLPVSCSNRFRSKCKGTKQIEALTQVSIDAAGSVKRPDIIVYLNSRPSVLLEVKVDAAIQKHNRESVEANGSIYADSGTAIAFQSQLETYSKWISLQNSGDWLGAVILLTHGTRAPDGFENDGREGDAVIGVTREWKDVGRWLTDNLDLRQSEMTHCALASDFNHFLERQGLMTNFISSRDLAATALFISAYKALRHTFWTVISAVASKHPKSRGGNFHLDFWSDGHAYWAWYYLNSKVNLPASKFYIAIGVCFPDQGALGCDNPVGIPKHEPFFFVLIADDWESKKASELLRKTPEGWVETHDGYSAITTRAVSQFGADPDIRAVTDCLGSGRGRASSSLYSDLRGRAGRDYTRGGGMLNGRVRCRPWAIPALAPSAPHNSCLY